MASHVARIGNGCYSAVKRSEIMPFVATWMDLEMIILSEVSQKETDSCHMISLLCGIQKSMKVAQLCPTLCDYMDCSPQAPLSMGFSRQEYWRR